ncbi:sporulation protein YpjB [Peribacillus sp. SCS-37]|uniref:sporulation protein YpjB n=1 Tax=Paraperibacillus esterisolvens TaxID=3115296 RepID=UPI0039067412
MLKNLCLLFALIWILPLSVHAQSSLERLDKIADEALQLVRGDRLPETVRMLDYFSNQFMALNEKEEAFNMDELRIMSSAYDEAVKAVESKTATLTERISQVTKLRLVVDAIGTNHQPMWTEMEDQMMATFTAAKQAIKTQDMEKLDQGLNLILSQYSLIYPSLAVDISPEKIQKLDARVQYIGQSSPGMLLKKNNSDELNALQTDLQSIFEDMKEDEADPSLWWVIISTGSIIIMTLSYVGWRKYRGGKTSVSKGKEQND